MGKIKKFDIIFGEENRTYYAGQTLSGLVILDLSDSIKIRGIKVRFLGEASVQFSDCKTGKTCSDREQYFDEISMIFGNVSGSLDTSKSKDTSVSSTSSTGADNQILAPGYHEFPFVFNIPPSAPSSYENKLGSVRYSCKAYIHRPWKFDLNLKKPFSIISIVDLNQQPLAFTPGFGKTEQRFSFKDRLLACVRGGISVEMKIDRSAFVSGESILLNAEVQNSSSDKVKSVEAYVVQNVIFTAKSGKKFVPGQEKIALIKHGALQRHELLIWRQEPMTLPPLPPTKLGKCRLITVDYMLKFVVSLESDKQILLQMPIVIGTIPLHQGEVRWLPSEVNQHTTPRPTLRTQPSAPPVDLMDAPPSYEECVFMDQGDFRDAEDNEHTSGDLSYRPRYRDRPGSGPKIGGDVAERKIFWMLRVAARRQAFRPARGYSKQPKDFANRH